MFLDSSRMFYIESFFDEIINYYNSNYYVVDDFGYLQKIDRKDHNKIYRFMYM